MQNGCDGEAATRRVSEVVSMARADKFVGRIVRFGGHAGHRVTRPRLRVGLVQLHQAEMNPRRPIPMRRMSTSYVLPITK